MLLQVHTAAASPGFADKTNSRTAGSTDPSSGIQAGETDDAATGETVEPEQINLPGTESMPVLIDLGAGKCIPCKLMAPILEKLAVEFETVFDVEYLDVGKDPSLAKEHGVRIIPTQIFKDASGVELYRHEGFFSREDILRTWNKFGVDTSQAESAATGDNRETRSVGDKP